MSPARAVATDRLAWGASPLIAPRVVHLLQAPLELIHPSRLVLGLAAK